MEDLLRLLGYESADGLMLQFGIEPKSLTFPATITAREAAAAILHFWALHPGKLKTATLEDNPDGTIRIVIELSS